jgi:WD40 repeat protein
VNTEDLAFLQDHVSTIDGQRPERLEEVRGRIQAARRRRATGTVVAACLAMAVAVAGVALARSTDHRHEPAPPIHYVPGGAVLGVDFNSEVATQVAGKPLPALPGFPPHPDTLEFSPDGTRIFYASFEGGLYSLDLTTGQETLLGSCPPPRGDTCAGVVAPDGTRVAYALHHNVYLKDLRTRATSPVFRPEHATIDSFVNALSWAPDDRRIAFVENSWGKSESSWLTVLDSATGKITHVVGDVAAEGPPAWSPDGTALAYIRATRVPGQQPGVGKISLVLMTVPAGGGEPRQVHAIGTCKYVDRPSHKSYSCGLPGLAWAPDGTRLAVTLPSSPDVGPVYSVRTDGSGWHKLSDGNFYYGLAWQPPASSAH